MHSFLPLWLVSKYNISAEDVCYAMKLFNTPNKKAVASTAGKLSGFMNGIGNAISDTLTAATSNTYMLRLNSGEFHVISEKQACMCLHIQEIRGDIQFEPSIVRFTAFFMRGNLGTISFKFEADNITENFKGDLKQFLTDFGSMQSVFSYDNLLNKFFTVNFLTQETTEKLYKFKSRKKAETLISFDEKSIFFYNERRKICFEDVLAYYCENGYYSFLIKENVGFELVEIFEDAASEIPELELNLVRDVSEIPESELHIPVPGNLLESKSFLAAFKVNELSIVAIDEEIFVCRGVELHKCGMFKSGNYVYVTMENGVTEKYAGCEQITSVLSLLPVGYDSIFLGKKVPQPFVVNDKITQFIVNDSSLDSGLVVYEYANMLEYKYTAEECSCKISFVYDNDPVELITANSLGMYISVCQEKVQVGTTIKEYTINQLYDYYYKNLSKNFLAATFAEIYKTEKLLNDDISLEEIINAMRADDSEVTRNVFASFIGKFKNVEDLQSDLMQKVALLEIQRKKIQKLYDEWTLYYPHYMATVQIAWLKNVFGSNNVSNELLNSEYWKCVTQLKRILASCNAYVQKSMNEIAMCTNKLSAALPGEVKRADVTQNLRITSNSKETMLKASTDVMAGVAAGVGLANIFIRGFSATNPLAISMSAKMLVDSYIKDADMRKDIKAFGTQSLEWWAVFIKGIRIHILEAANAMNEYNKLCLKRDTALFKKLSVDEQKSVKTKLSRELKDKIIDGVDDKFIEIMPQFNLRISNIIEEIEGNSRLCNLMLNEFESNLFIY